MKIEQRTVYISEDGQEFDSESACKQYEKEKDFSYIIATYIEQYSSDYYNSGTRMDIAEAIACKFQELIEKYNAL